MSILTMSLLVPTTPQSLSSSKALTGCPLWPQSLCLTKKLSLLSLKTTPIRMGGGPRTYPGGVSKWQWKRMQAKKEKQLLKARLARERQIYEMRKRAELKAAVSELERPWEAVEKPPVLFSVSADEQLKVLADRFQKPGGLDLWTDRDGPELFRPDNGLSSSRFFPKGVVHSVKPYRETGKLGDPSDKIEGSGLDEDTKSGRVRENFGESGLEGKGYQRNSMSSRGGMSKGGKRIEPRSLKGVAKEGENRNVNGRFGHKGSNRNHVNGSEGMSSANVGFYDRDDRRSGGPGTSSRLGKNRNVNGRFGMNGASRNHVNVSDGKSSENAGFYGRDDRRGSSREGEHRNVNGRFGKKVISRNHVTDSEGISSGDAGSYDRDDRRSRETGSSSRESRRGDAVKKGQNVNLETFELSLQNDGSYGF